MRVKKIAISLPPDVLAEVDRAAAEGGMSRSGFIAEILRRTARIRRDRRITRAINDFFDEEGVIEEQSGTAEAFSRDFHARAETTW